MAVNSPFAQFEADAMEVLFCAEEESRRLLQGSVGDGQIFIGLIKNKGRVGAQLRKHIGLQEARRELQAVIGVGAGRGYAVHTIDIPFTNTASRLLQIAYDSAINSDTKVRPAHLLDALAQVTKQYWIQDVLTDMDNSHSSAPELGYFCNQDQRDQ